MFKSFVLRTVDASARRPYLVLFCALFTISVTWWYASHLEPRSDFLDLLPKDSAGYQAYTHQLGRTGGGASLLVIAESPDRAKNEAFIDAVSLKLADYQKTHPQLISYLETGTKDVRNFFQTNKWLYADQKDLTDADETLDHQIAIRSGMVTDLFADDDDDDDKSKDGGARDSGAAVAGAQSGDAGAVAASGGDPDEKKPTLGMTEYFDRWDKKSKDKDDFPTGYFETVEGDMIGMRIVSPSTGTGDRGGDQLLSDVTALVDSMKKDPSLVPANMQIGFAGDIPNAHEEKESIVSDAAIATVLTIIAVWVLIAVFFRSVWSLAVIALPVFIGVGCAYSFAMAAYGYVNTSGMFLGAIILGNGINYPIVLLSRYREFVARGMTPDVARREAVWNAFRAELVGALVAGIAYGSLTVTRFRAFNQFGAIGFVGMLLVWLSMIPCVPALLVIIDRVQEKLPKWMRDPKSPIKADGSRGFVTHFIASATERKPWIFVGLAIVALVGLGSRLPTFLHDPWEYNFDRLGSRGSKTTGAGLWSNKAEKVFGGKMNVAGAMILADTPEQVPLLKAQILKNDAADKQGQLIAQVSTVDDLLPGTPDEQKAKIAVLDDLRERLSPAVIAAQPESDRKRLEEMRPPEQIHILTPAELPPLLRRRFTENNGTVGTVFYVKPQNSVSISDGHNAIRMAETTDNLHLPDGTIVKTASRWTVYAEMLHSMEHDGPLATAVSFGMVVLVVIIATSSLPGAAAVLGVLLCGVIWALGGAVIGGLKLNFLNFIALPITFGIGCEYPFNVFDRSRLLGGDVSSAVRRTGGAVALCSLTTTIGYGSLLMSDQQALQSFGKLAMSGEIACLAGALLVLPALLQLMPKWRAYAKKTHPIDPHDVPVATSATTETAVP